MSGHKAVHISAIDPIEAPDEPFWRPVRRTLGIGAFGVNVFGAHEPGAPAIEDHTETEGNGGGHEELYFVASGRAEFTIDGETVDAPSGTFVFVPDPEARRAAVAREAGTEIVCMGARPGGFEPSPWEMKPLS